ncbi:hypothetical protein KM043_010020 [Ampulex compressa]|nr:hypothetical protein KM043_010020 [Ampulex compressa]
MPIEPAGRGFGVALPATRSRYIAPSYHGHLRSDGANLFQGMHECVLVACAGERRATEKSESRTRSLMHPTMPLVYLLPVVLTMSGAPPAKD